MPLILLFPPRGLSARSLHVFPYPSELFSLQPDANTDDQRFFPGHHHRGIYEQENATFSFFRYVVATMKVIPLQCKLHHLRARRVSKRYRTLPNPPRGLDHALQPSALCAYTGDPLFALVSHPEALHTFLRYPVRASESMAHRSSRQGYRRSPQSEGELGEGFV